jgi:predicted peptidase
MDISSKKIEAYNYYLNNSTLPESKFIYNGRKIHCINFEVLNQKRYFLYVEQFDSAHDAIIFFHGSRSIAYECAFDVTNLLVTWKGPIIFGQAGAPGEIISPYIHPIFGDVSYGELYFEIRDEVSQFKIDLEYTKILINYLGNRNIYFMGHSNGGIFGLLVMLHLHPSTFKGVVCHMGGIGHDPHYYLDFKYFEEFNPQSYPKILFYTGTHDEYRVPTLQAMDIFKAYDFETSLYIEEGIGHEYNHNVVENVVLEWIYGIN